MVFQRVSIVTGVLGCVRYSNVNRENVAIEPKEFRVSRPNLNGVPGVADELNPDAQSTIAGDEGDSTTRMIDWSLGLCLGRNELSIIEDAFDTMTADTERSLNQTFAAYTKSIPMFLDIEVKQAHQKAPPDVQLAIWAGALYKKRRYHGWDTSLPQPGIVVDGLQWDLYITYERSPGRLVRMLSFIEAIHTNIFIYR